MGMRCDEFYGMDAASDPACQSRDGRRAAAFERLGSTSAWTPADSDGGFDLGRKLFCGPGAGAPLDGDAPLQERGGADWAVRQQDPLHRLRRRAVDRPHLGCVALENMSIVGHQPNVLRARGVTFDKGVEAQEEGANDHKFVGVGQCCDPAADPRCPAECAGQGSRLNFFHWRPPHAPTVVRVLPANMSALGFHILLGGSIDTERRRFVYLGGDGEVMVALHADTGRVLAHAAWDVRKLGKIFRVLALPPQKQHEATAQSPMAAAA
jgi:hypothetical protein